MLKWLGLGLLALVQMVAYQNCGADFVVRDNLTLASASGGVCEATLEAQFKTSYQSFLKTNCATCHTSKGPGNGAFADSNDDLAFNAFLNIGHDRIDVNATNSAHAGGYTGSQNSSAINLAQQEWEAAEASCKGGGTATQGLVTSAKVMSATATAKDITWNLDTEMASGSASTGGAQLIIAVREQASANGTPVYYFSNPRLKGGTKTVTLSGGIMVRINGQEQVLGSTWSRADNSAAPGATTVLSTAQMIIEFPAYATTDTLALSIDALSAQ